MSRRAPTPAADRATQNSQTLKTLVKLEGNKSCADCKRNKHPRWASWNLGVFVCIRCSGIHRGMGTHISRVKSVDLDAWTDEQMQSILRWGNTRANKYWEAKLAPGHVPSDAKIENFIRTKYESKRWVMDGDIPDPATLDGDGDEDVPLGVVQEKHKLSQPNPARASGSASQPPPPVKPAAIVDIFGDQPSSVARPTAVAPAPPLAGQPAAAGAVRGARPAESLLGLDFLGASSKPSSGTGMSGTGSAETRGAVPSRPDLKQSILSLYASAPRLPASSSLGESSTVGSQAHSQPQAGLHDAFSSLAFETPSPASQQNPTASSSGAPGGVRSQKALPAVPQLTNAPSSSTGFPDIGQQPNLGARRTPLPTGASGPTYLSSIASTFSSTPRDQKPPQVKTDLKPNSDFGSMLDFSASPGPVSAVGLSGPSSGQPKPSVFNLSASQPSSNQPKPIGTGSHASQTGAYPSGFSTADSWASNEIWSSNDSSSTGMPSGPRVPAATTAGQSRWGGNALNPSLPSGNPPIISADEDFGGWSSAVPVTPSATDGRGRSATGGAGTGLNNGDDLFSNVWE